MKNAAFVSFAIMMVAFMPIFASASAGMSFSLSTGAAKLCSCSTTQITGTLFSGGYGVYTLESNSKWITFAPDTVSLGPGESAPVYIYLTTDCTSPPKDYPIEITVRSDAGLTETKQIVATVLPCHSVELKVSPSDAKACLEESAHFSLDITNNGKADEEYIISSSTGTLEAERVYLGRNETKTIGLDVPANDTQKEAVILVRSASTYAAASKTAKISGINCHSAALYVSPEEKTACLKDSVNYSISLKNTGTRKDEFQVNSTFGALSDKYVSLEAGESKKITLSAQSGTPGNYLFYIAAVSRYVKAETRGTFKAVQCRGVEASIAPSEQIVCRGFPVNYSVRIKNTGAIDDTYVLSSNFGQLNTEKITVPKGDTKSALLEIPANMLNNETFVDIEAVSADDSGVVSLGRAIQKTENCYGLNSSVTGTKEAVCAGETVRLAINAENTGKLADEYEINSNIGAISKKYLNLSPGEKTTLAITIPTDISDSGKKSINISISSKNANTTNAINLEIESAQSCYGFDLSIKEDTKFTNDSNGKLFEINVLNTGKGNSNFSAKLEAPLWAYISPKEFMLQEKKNATVYIYAAPAYGTKNDAYIMKLTVKNNIGFVKNEFAQLVLGNVTPLDLSKMRGQSMPAGAAVKNTASQKSLYVIVLGIIVIALIIFGPGMFGKKKENTGDDSERIEMKSEFPEELIGTDKTVTFEPSEEKMPEAEEEKTEEEKEKAGEEKSDKKKPAKKEKKSRASGFQEGIIGADKMVEFESSEEDNPEAAEKKKAKKPKPKSPKKELQDILDNV